MASQPSRPWFRLASLARLAPETNPTPPAEPAAGQSRPPFRPVSRPTLPRAQPGELTSSPTTVSLPTSPVAKPMASTVSVPTTPKPASTTTSVATYSGNKTVTSVIARVPSVAEQTKIPSVAETQTKILSVAEQKTAVVQKSITDKPNTTEVINGVKSSIENPGKQAEYHKETKEKAHQKKILSESVEGSMRVITIAGENKGDFRKVINGFEGNPSRRHLQDKNNNPETDSSSNEEQGKLKMKDKNRKGKGMNWSPIYYAFINSNVQGINNSIVYNSSFANHDPGVHLALSMKPSGGGFQDKDRISGHHD